MADVTINDLTSKASPVDGDQLEIDDGAGGSFKTTKAQLLATIQAEVDTKIAAVIEDLQPRLGGDLDLNGSSIYQLLLTQGGNSFVPGEIGAIGPGGDVYRASAGTLFGGGTTSLVMSLDTITGGNNGRFALLGEVKGLTGGSAGNPAYLSTTEGQVTTTAPSASGNIVRLVGYWRSATVFDFSPSTDWIEIA